MSAMLMIFGLVILALTGWFVYVLAVPQHSIPRAVLFLVVNVVVQFPIRSYFNRRLRKNPASPFGTMFVMALAGLVATVIVAKLFHAF